MRGSTAIGARQRGPLLLAARQRNPALADHRVVALREIGDVLVEPRDGGGGDDPCRRAIDGRSAEAFALRSAARLKPSRVLTRRRRSRPARTRRCRPACPRTGTAPAARSRSRRAASPSGISRTSTPSMNTVPGGGSCSRASSEISVDLPEPVTPTSATVCAGRDRRGHVVQDRRVAVREHEIAEFDRATDHCGLRGIRGLRIDLRIAVSRASAIRSAIAGSDVEHLEHPLPRRHAALQHVGHPAERNHRPAQHRQIRVERDELADRDPALDHLAAAQPDDDERAEAEEEAHAREEESLQHDQAPVAAQVLLDRPPEPLELGLFLAVGADDADARQRFLRDRADLGQLRLNLLESLVNRAAEHLHRNRHERQRDQRPQRQPRVDRRS